MAAKRKEPSTAGSISGRVRSALGLPLDGVDVDARGPDGKTRSATTKGGGLYSIAGLAPGAYIVEVRVPGGFLDEPARMIKVPPGTAVPDIDFGLKPKPAAPTGPVGPTPTGVTSPPVPTGLSLPVTLPPTPTSATPPAATYPATPTGPSAGPATTEIDEFRRLLFSDDLNIEGPVAEDEALEAIALFAVSNVLLAGLGRRRVGSGDKVDVLGMLTLYYGLQDKSLASRIVVRSRDLWRAKVNGGTSVEDELKSLRDALDRLGEDVTFVGREAKRQFNLGINNSVAANVAFPALMRRLIDIAADPRLTLNLREEDAAGSTTSKDKIGEAYDLLAELKDVALKIVRSLSRYGTIATRRSNRDWAAFEKRAFTVLKKAGEHRFTEDVDERRILSVLADLLDKSFETVISPYFAMARNGTLLLLLVFETYIRAKQDLDDFDRDHLLALFQPEGAPAAFLTNRMRSHALVLKRYPLQGWN
jgi:carboxypeptidase family protein